MSKRKTQIDRAVEKIEAEIAELQRHYESRRQGLEAAADALRSQQQTRTRKPKAAKPVAMDRPA